MIKKNIIITGAAGFIFSNFVRYVLKERSNYNIISVDKIINPHNLHNIYANRAHKFYLGDISDKHFINTLFEIEKPDIVVNGAAASNVDDSIKDATPFVISNVLGTQVLIDACLTHKVSKFIQVSTDEVNGQLTTITDQPWSEESPINPRNMYSATKASAELLVKAAHVTHGLQYNITRSCNNLGPRQSTKNLVPKIIKCILNNEKIPIYGKGEQVREWIHVSDNCEAILNVIEKGLPNETYNIGTGYSLSNLEMAHTICKVMEADYNLIDFIDDPRPGHDFRYEMNSNKIRELGWKPSFKFVEAVQNTCNFYTRNKWFLGQM